MISENLTFLRRAHGYSQEQVAEKVGVSRQAVAKWESGETVPDLSNSVLLANMYQVTLDNLVNHDSEKESVPIPPKGKHIFGTVTVGERGQIVIPKKAREIFDIHSGDSLMVVGDEGQGIALVKAEAFLNLAREILEKGGDGK